MDAKFQAAVAAVREGDPERFKALLTADPSLATTRSSTSHPTLLQCVADINTATRDIRNSARLIGAVRNLVTVSTTSR